ncbi:hypothetical protein [Staphylococcus epidermidis]|uniref:hypothetical protein n=1 Tax=Staphylococcus epidermidis TaxID=1282 RepID=UPI0037D9B632
MLTNEFVLMREISNQLNPITPHHTPLISTFLLSFPNFSTIPIIIPTFKPIVHNKTSHFLSKYLPIIFLPPILLSLLTPPFLPLFPS